MYFLVLYANNIKKERGKTMLTVLTRTFIIYISLIAVMRIMGKRQLGELEISDLVTTFLISEIASLPITDTEIPLSHAIIPIVVLLSLEVGISTLLSKIPKIKFIFSARPSTIIRDGEICKNVLEDSRLSFDELFSQLRQQGYDDISQIKYAILEQNGNITVIQKAQYKPLCADTLGIKVKEPGLFHIIIEHGKINCHGLKEISYTEAELNKILFSLGYTSNDIYLMMINDAHEIRIIPKEGKNK
ncbi:MAG: DUF421 domain-containing protein [Ruminococcaceae bacterium]|nr:DUF421 domain-containing protein [Oscillospiraceae bacterium]